VTHSRPAIYELLDEHGLAARRELGQNFVADPNTVRRIAELAQVGEGDLVVEIGPGLGSLTLALIETGAAVVAIELDAGLAVVAAAVVGDAATIIEADAQTIDWGELVGDHEGPVHVVANLPYNIGTTLVLDLLADVPIVETITVLVQSEVGERFAAAPGSKIYGIPSVMAALHADVAVVATVPPSVFVPKPKVQSAVVRFVRRPGPPPIAHERLALVVRAGFGQRRKMLRRSLNPLLSEAQLVAIDVDPTARAEQLDLAAWVRIASAVGS
jgi:16S rRNA (adenine1518-N6/adenine1519-N6)-dimethyltransferase